MKNIAKTFFTLLIGMSIGTAGLAAAAPGTVEAALTKLKIVVNGQEAQLSNTPLVYKGTTYLPVREVANLLDASLNYDGANKKIELNTKGDDSVPISSTVQWFSIRELSKDYGIKVIMDTETTISYKDKEIIFPLSIYDKSSDSIVISSQGNEASLKIEDGLLYLDQSSLSLLGI